MTWIVLEICREVLSKTLLLGMINNNDYYKWLEEGKRVRISVRAIIFNRNRDKVLMQKEIGAQEEHAGFPGGGLEVGESFEACIEREMSEETNAKIDSAEYLFVVENFMSYQGEIRHAIGHYFEVELDREDVQSRDRFLEYWWMSILHLGEVDIRPHVVRDRIVDGTYRSVSHLISRGNGAR